MVPVVVAEGDPYARGLALGRGLAEPIGRSLAFYRSWFERRGLGRDDLAALLRPYRAAAARVLPEQAATLAGLAAGAEADPVELFAVNAFEELEGAGRLVPERCSTFTAVAEGVTLLAHNEQWLAGDRGNVALVIERPHDGSAAVVSATVACCLPAVGVSTAGGAQGIDSLTASDDGPGVPRVLVSRHALAAAGRDDAVRRAGLAGRAGGYAHVFAFRGGEAFAVETTARALAVVPGPGGHANHYLDPALAALGEEPSEGSRARQARLDGLLAERPPASPAEAMALLSDHDSSPQALCKHGDAADGDDVSAVVFSLVCELESERLWLAPGNPCETPYEEIALADVV